MKRGEICELMKTSTRITADLQRKGNGNYKTSVRAKSWKLDNFLQPDNQDVFLCLLNLSDINLGS